MRNKGRAQALNIDTIRKDIPVSSFVKEFQIWTIEPNGENQFDETMDIFLHGIMNDGGELL